MTARITTTGMSRGNTNPAGMAGSKTSAKREVVEKELPLFAGELNVLAEDMRSSSYEAALTPGLRRGSTRPCCPTSPAG